MRHEVTLKALLSGRPDDAVDVLMNFAPYRPEDIFETTPNRLFYETQVSWVISGRQVVVHVETQKDLLAIAGHFWVEPRVLPESPV